MLPCICPVIDHRWRQNVVRTKKWHTRRYPSVSLMCLPHFDVLCDLLLDRCTATWNLFVLYNKKNKFCTHKSCFTSRKAGDSGALPILKNTKKSHLASSMIYTKWSNPIGGCSLAKNCDWFREITPLSNLTRVSLLVEWKLTAKQELNCEIYNS